MSEEINNVVAEDVATLLDLVIYPADILRQHAEPVVDFDDELEQLIKDMFYTMRINEGIGLAAPQVGLSKRIIVMMLETPLVLINPVIIAKDGEQEFEEGCLSLPETFAVVKSAASVRVAYQTSKGVHEELSADGVSAVCIQHEIEHLDGKIFTDRLSALKRLRANRRATKIKSKIEKGSK